MSILEKFNDVIKNSLPEMVGKELNQFIKDAEIIRQDRNTLEKKYELSQKDIARLNSEISDLKSKLKSQDEIDAAIANYKKLREQDFLINRDMEINNLRSQLEAEKRVSCSITDLVRTLFREPIKVMETIKQIPVRENKYQSVYKDGYYEDKIVGEDTIIRDLTETKKESKEWNIYC